MTLPASTAGRQLWGLLPEVYRTRDNGDLAAYLDACGELLDRVRDTLDQRLADSFPDRPAQGPAAQGWLLPYFAQLLDVRLVSPHLEGRRSEVSRAVAWRQSKGTAGSIEEIAEAVAQLEVEVQEGWRRVAATPRMEAPGRPVTVDLRRSSRAVRALAEEEGSRHSRFSGQTVSWRQRSSAGAPCFEGSFEDASRRTPDLRTPSWGRGHYHPRRLLLFVPPAAGLFPLDGIHFPWSERGDHLLDEHLIDEDGGNLRRISNPGSLPGSAAATVTTRPPKFEEPRLRVEGVNFLGTLSFEGGRFELSRSAAGKVVVAGGGGGGEPVLKAVDCLIGEIEAPGARLELEYCTVRGKITCGAIQASDCLFDGEISLGGAGTGCIRYSRIPPALAGLPKAVLRRHRTTVDRPVFVDFAYCEGDGVERRSSELGRFGYGVLHPATPSSIRFGAEDGGEMGAFHHQKLCLQTAAVAAKLEDFLPVGIEAVLIPDPRLLTAPPETASA